MLKLPEPWCGVPEGLATPEATSLNPAPDRVRGSAESVHSKLVPFWFPVTVSLKWLKLDTPSPGPQVQLVWVQLVGSTAVRFAISSRNAATGMLKVAATDTVRAKNGSLEVAVRARGSETPAPVLPPPPGFFIVTLLLSGIASRAWSLNAAAEPPPHAAAETARTSTAFFTAFS